MKLTCLCHSSRSGSGTFLAWSHRITRAAFLATIDWTLNHFLGVARFALDALPVGVAWGMESFLAAEMEEVVDE